MSFSWDGKRGSAALGVGTILFALTMSVVGCGGGGGANESAWLGNWMEGGTQSTTCGTVSATTQISMLVVFSAGVKSGTIQTYADSCTLVWDVSGSKAILESGQACTVSVNGVNATVGWTASTLTLNGNTMTAVTGGAATNGCSFTQQATLTRL
jgi:hypothetical protein